MTLGPMSWPSIGITQPREPLELDGWQAIFSRVYQELTPNIRSGGLH